jgi:hypothetical protein
MAARLSWATDDRLTGPAKFLWADFRHALGMTAGMVGAWIATIAVTIGLFRPGDTIAGALAEFDLLLFDASADVLGIGFLFGFAALTFRNLSGLPAVQHLPMVVRHLRVLPISAARVVVTLIARRAVGWLAVWLVLMAVHATVRGFPASLRVDWLVVAIGVDSVLHAAQLRWASRSYGMWVAILLLMPGFKLLANLPLRRHVDASILALIPVAFALAALVFGAIWLHRLVTQRSEVFRHVPRPA